MSTKSAEDRPPSPFPAKFRRSTVVDERCHCGALRSVHEDTFAFGHGPCPPTGCFKFTWASMVLKGADNAKRKR